MQSLIKALENWSKATNAIQEKHGSRAFSHIWIQDLLQACDDHLPTLKQCLNPASPTTAPDQPDLVDSVGLATNKPGPSSPPQTTSHGNTSNDWESVTPNTRSGQEPSPPSSSPSKKPSQDNA